MVWCEWGLKSCATAWGLQTCASSTANEARHDLGNVITHLAIKIITARKTIIREKWGMSCIQQTFCWNSTGRMNLPPDRNSKYGVTQVCIVNMPCGKWKIISEQPVNWFCHLFRMSPLKYKPPLFKTFWNLWFSCVRNWDSGEILVPNI